jgi:hypothetical protein
VLDDQPTTCVVGGVHMYGTSSQLRPVQQSGSEQFVCMCELRRCFQQVLQLLCASLYRTLPGAQG